MRTKKTATIVLVNLVAATLFAGVAGNAHARRDQAGNTDPTPEVQPGSVLQTKSGQCTFNFLFTGSDGNRYMGSAGHCILGDTPENNAREKVWAAGHGPNAKDGARTRVGKFAYAVLRGTKDFSLVRLKDNVVANPQMCHFGGPTGINDDQSSSPATLMYCGRGVGVGDIAPARTGLALSMANPKFISMVGVALPGDSGAGVTTEDGRAVGVLVDVGLHAESLGSNGLDLGVIGITRLGPQLARAEKVLGIDLELQTASQL